MKIKTGITAMSGGLGITTKIAFERLINSTMVIISGLI
jgi:hypothetical protein